MTLGQRSTVGIIVNMYLSLEIGLKNNPCINEHDMAQHDMAQHDMAQAYGSTLFPFLPTVANEKPTQILSRLAATQSYYRLSRH
jgi:hypothetical protein